MSVLVDMEKFVLEVPSAGVAGSGLSTLHKLARSSFPCDGWLGHRKSPASGPSSQNYHRASGFNVQKRTPGVSSGVLCSRGLSTLYKLPQCSEVPSAVAEWGSGSL
jgi:hypothetical protein